MIRLLQLLIFGYSHEHRWETVHLVNVYEAGKKDTPYAHDYECRCTVCGKIKRFRV